MSNDEKNINVYRSCTDLETCDMMIATHIGETTKILSPCCVLSVSNSAAELTDDPEESLNNFLEFRRNMIEENKRVYHTDDQTRVYTNQCLYCPKYNIDEWGAITSDTIPYINLSMYPSPCQSKCLYCNIHLSDQSIDDRSKEAYDRVFKFLRYLKENNILKEDIIYQVSTGEISIHPYKDKILEIVDGSPVTFFSNCYKFDQEIANHLKADARSTINVSIDSGTATTWKKIKGYNTFNSVLNNVRKYYKYCDQVNHQQIGLKYIVLPGINTRMEDYLGIIKIMKEFDIKDLIISRDVRVMYNMPETDKDELFNHIIDIATVCRLNGLSYKLAEGGFTISETDHVAEMVEKNMG